MILLPQMGDQFGNTRILTLDEVAIEINDINKCPS